MLQKLHTLYLGYLSPYYVAVKRVGNGMNEKGKLWSTADKGESKKYPTDRKLTWEINQSEETV